MLELPLGALRAGRTRTQLERRGIAFETDAYIVEDHLIWGATARIVENLLQTPYSEPVATGTPTRLPHSVHEPS